MAKYVTIRNQSQGNTVVPLAKWCESFWCQLRGLQFAPPIPDDYGLLFVSPGESIPGAAIHMLFMRFPIGVIWLNRDGVVVDIKTAFPWRLAYAPKAPAKYYIEANVSALDRARLGDTLTFENRAT
jgi:uncharacterized protein